MSDSELTAAIRAAPGTCPVCGAEACLRPHRPRHAPENEAVVLCAMSCNNCDSHWIEEYYLAAARDVIVRARDVDHG